MSVHHTLRRAEEPDSALRQLFSDLVNRLYREPDSARRIELLLDSAIEYYDADRAYVIEGDKELIIGINTYERCAPGMPHQQDTILEMPVEMLHRWVEIHNRHESTIIEDMEAIRERYPSEYRYFTDSEVHSVIIVPFSKRISMGFVGIDNPKRHNGDSIPLHVLSYAIVIELNEIKLVKENAAIRGVSNHPRDIVNVRLLGDMEIIAQGGMLRGSSLSAQQYALLAIMLLNPKKDYTPWMLYNILCPGRESDNPGNVINNIVYKVRRELESIGIKDLICTERGVFHVNSRYKLIVDVERLRQYFYSVRATADETERLSLCCSALELYQNPLHPIICDYIAIMHEAAELNNMYFFLAMECAKLHLKRQEHYEAYVIIKKALLLEPQHPDMMLLMVKTMKAAGAPNLRAYIQQVEEHLESVDRVKLYDIFEGRDSL